MHTRFVLGGFVVVASLAISAPRVVAADAEMEAMFVDPDSAEAGPYRDVGDRAIDRFGYTLVSEATSSVARDGPVAAIAAGHLKGLPMIGGTVAGVPRIIAMKVTSLKTRNPANAPDPAEKLALDKVQNDLESGTPPTIVVQHVHRSDGGEEWRVYKPLAMLRQCMVCHGSTDDQPADVRAALQEKYPTDQATGYRVGEWCGLIRVTVAEPPAAATKAAPAQAAKHTAP